MGESARRVGRPSTFGREDIVRVGCRIGMRDLRVGAVAAELGVSPGAVYRHIGDRWELERLVGESLLGELQIPDDPAHDVTEHLVAVAVCLRGYVAAHPGLASYMLVLFPRGEGGARLVRNEVAALGRRGYGTDVAVMLAGVVARIALSLTAADELRQGVNDDSEFLGEHEVSHEILAGQGEIGPAYEQRWLISDDEYFRMLIGGAVRGFVAAAPAGRPRAGVIAALRESLEQQ